MATQINLGSISVDVVFKDIKNIHLSVYPPAGRVSVSAPRRMSLDNIRVFTIAKLGWIKDQQSNSAGRSVNRHENIWTAKVITSGERDICLGSRRPTWHRWWSCSIAVCCSAFDLAPIAVNGKTWWRVGIGNKSSSYCQS